MSFINPDAPGPERPVPTLDVIDEERLRTLESYGILDTPAEEAFNDVVTIASEVCAAPYALISLVAEERQWFKARLGLEACETPIEQSVCAHALGEPDMLIIPDLTKDSRTDRNPLVTGAPHVRFYGGVVLRAPNGHAIGSVCVLDDKPRPGGLTESQKTVLRALGRQVMAMLETRKGLIRSVDDQVALGRAARERAEQASVLEKQELKLRLAVDATQMGIFDYDLVTGELHWDARVRELFGLSPTAPVDYETAFLAGVHPDDRQAADQAVKAALDPAGSGSFDSEYRTVSPDGTIRWLAARGQTQKEDGKVVRFVGAVRDITARRTADDKVAATLERYRLVGQVTKDVIWDWDLDAGHVLWNDALTEAYGYEVADIEPTPGWWFDHVHPDDRDRVRDDIFRVIDGAGRDWSHEYRFRRANGSWADVFDRGSMIRDADGRPLRMIGAMFDDSVRKAEQERRDLLTRELGHRMKNLLGLVQAIAAQTLRGAESSAAAFETLSGRLVALSRAQDILVDGRADADASRLADIIDEAVRPHLDAPERITSQGPRVEIGPKAALPIVLMLHELATNAVKYGALSRPDGRIAIDWSVDGDRGAEALRFVWAETGGPPVAPPVRTGFGTRLIERALAGQLGAAVTLDYPPGGLMCEVQAPLDQLRQGL